MTDTESADAIFYNGDVITVEGDPDTWEVQAVAVKNGKILYAGTKLDALRYKGSQSEMVNLEGDTLVPGFVEPHTHPDTSAVVYKLDVDASGLLTDPPPDKDQVWKEIEEAIAKAEAGDWVVVWGFNGMLIPGLELPNLEEADKMAPTVCLALWVQGAHVMMANSKALETAGVDKTTEVVGGEFLKDEDGNLTGMCYEVGAVNKVMSALPKFTDEVADEYMKDSLNLYGREGFTTVGALGIGDPDAVKRIRTLANSDYCPVRVVAYLDENSMNAEDAAAGGECVPSKPSDAAFSHMGVKFWADGSPYSGSIAVQEPFVDSKVTRDLGFLPYPNYGFLSFEHSDLHKRMQRFHERYFQVCCHTHGERAVDQVLDIYETILRDEPREDHRYRLEHCALIRKDQIQRAKDLGVYLSFYPDHIWFYGSFLRDDILGPERAQRIMPFKSALEAGHEISAHSDTPCTTLGVLRVIKTMATRTIRPPSEELEGKDDLILDPEECISVDEALKCVTINAAKQLFHEDFIGSIAKGKVADFTRLSGNPRKVPVMEIDKIEIKKTYRAGNEAKFFGTYEMPRGVMKRGLKNLKMVFKK